jgi:hypothetical protein
MGNSQRPLSGLHSSSVTLRQRPRSDRADFRRASSRLNPRRGRFCGLAADLRALATRRYLNEWRLSGSVKIGRKRPRRVAANLRVRNDLEGRPQGWLLAPT